MDDVKRLVELKTEVLRFSSDFFIKKGFKWLLPKILSPVTDPLWPDPQEQGIEPLEVEVKTYGQKFRLMHSMILHKQIAISRGIDKLFILSPNIRIENREPDGWHSFEFTQLDFEGEYLTQYDVMSILSEYIIELTEHLDKVGLIDKHEKPFIYFRRGNFKYYDWEMIVDKYGDEKTILKKEKKPFFITNIPREFYDFYDEKTGKWRNYDLYIPPYGEISSGGEREWEYEKILQKIKSGNLKPELFGGYLEYVKKGLLRPSAGAGIGIERIVTIFLGEGNIEKSQVFPRIPFKEIKI